MIKYISDLKRRYDHIKVVNQDEAEEYKPAMVIYKEDMPGMAFCILTDAIWKYIEPRANLDRQTIESDVLEFNQVLMKNQAAQKAARTIRMSDIEKARIVEDALCIAFAIALNRTMRIMLCTSYNLAKCLHMFGIDPHVQAAIQLLLWIQDGLDQLKDMPEATPENKVAAGEVTVTIDGHKITKEVELNETDLITGE
ncbi:MAG: hypothetical protein CVU62_13240 [Deltaproteobacteria bacterium HGW-Deltaproteobacteria-2]|nr:MAG: hypothetical protein CVU62_13240 [Deltaproteobacteria bacterium HGW-Deltaproteobacteria-2]